MTAHTDILHSYFTAIATEFLFNGVDQKRNKNKTKENIDLFFPLLLFRF